MAVEKLSLFPLAAGVNAEGHLTLHGHRADDLAEQYGTPLYVFDTETIRHQIELYRRALAHYPGPSRLTYASKAFQCTALAGLMTREGVGFDVASAGEIFIATRGGAKPADMHLHGNNKTARDLSEALRTGVGRIVVDNFDELRLLRTMAAERRQQVNIWLRITPDVAVDTIHHYTLTGAADSKFGFSIDQAQIAAHQILVDSKQSPIRLVGLHIHLGSHFHDAGPMADAFEKLLDLAVSLREKYGWELQDFCAGGGWGVRYHPDDPPMPIEPYVLGIVEMLETGCRKRALAWPTLILEPGRSLIGQAGIAFYTVGGRKEIDQVRTYVSIDGGMADNPRPALYQANYTALLANRVREPELETVTVAGAFCESGDILIRSVNLPKAQTGDILAIPVSGAYHLAMGSNYNAALRPAVVFMDKNRVKVVQRRETFEDLTRRDVEF